MYDANGRSVSECNSCGPILHNRTILLVKRPYRLPPWLFSANGVEQPEVSYLSNKGSRDGTKAKKASKAEPGRVPQESKEERSEVRMEHKHCVPEIIEEQRKTPGDRTEEVWYSLMELRIHS
jgi:hypothetical protein